MTHHVASRLLIAASACSLLSSCGHSPKPELANFAGYTCNFLPTEQMYLGRVYREKDFYQFPAKIEEKSFLVYDQFKDGDAPKYGSKGESYTKLENVTLEAAAGVLGLKLTSEDKAALAAKGGLNSNVKLKRQIDKHFIQELSDQKANVIKAYFKSDRPSQLPYLNDGWKYYLVREIRTAEKLEYAVSRKELAGIELDATKVDGTFKVEGSNTSEYQVIGDFDQSLTFCMKVERLT